MLNDIEEHSRWDEEHRKICIDCYADWYDQMLEMAQEARIDAMIEREEEDVS